MRRVAREHAREILRLYRAVRLVNLPKEKQAAEVQTLERQGNQGSA